MKAALVPAAGQAPVYGEADDPVASDGEQLINVRAVAIAPLTKARASGSHYSSTAVFPLVPGVDGVGTTERGQRVYCLLPKPPLGTIAERTVVSESHSAPIPDGLDWVAAAALPNPGMSSWAALTERAHFERGETVLVNGATGVAGSLAVQIAKRLGAAKVVATGRNRPALDEVLHLGADVVVHIDESANGYDKFERAVEAQFREGVDVVLDYVWGESARRTILAAASGSPQGRAVRFVQIGTASAPTIELPGAALRSSGLVLMGSGIGSVSTKGLLRAIGQVYDEAVRAPFTIDTTTFRIEDIAAAWKAGNARSRAVVVMD